VVVTEEVKHAVNQQRTDLRIRRSAVRTRLPGSGVKGDHHVTEYGVIAGSPQTFAQREGQDIGRPILAAVVSIEHVHLGVVDQTHSQLSSLFAERSE